MTNNLLKTELTPKSSWSLSDQQLQQVLLRHRSTTSPDSIEVLLAQVNGQVFGLLMSQLYNIVRSGSQSLKVLEEIKINGVTWSRIEHRGQIIPVLPLATALLMRTSLSPLDESEILLSGRVRPDGSLDMIFGIALDEVMEVRQFRRDELRYLPSWLYRKRLGNLIIGALLVEPELLTLTDNFMVQENLTEKLLMSFSGLVNSAELSVDENRNSSLNAPKAAANYEQQPEQDKRRPIMLLNLDVLRSQLFGEPTKKL